MLKDYRKPTFFSLLGRARLFALRPTFDCRATVKLLPDLLGYLALFSYPDAAPRGRRFLIKSVLGYYSNRAFRPQDFDAILFDQLT